MNDETKQENNHICTTDAGGAGGWFRPELGGKYYGLPELPDRREYKTIEERAAELGDAYCQLKHPLVIEQINKELNVINKQITWKRKSKKVLGIYSWKH